MSLVPVYRCGFFENGGLQTKRPEVWEMYQYFDSFRTAENPISRSEAMYGSPTLYGVTRWVLLNMKTIEEKPLNTFRFMVDGDTTMVYRVQWWEDYYRGIKSAAKQYWQSGITLNQWLEKYPWGIDGTEHEILFTKDCMKSEPVEVSVTEMVAAQPDPILRNSFAHAILEAAEQGRAIGLAENDVAALA